MPVSEEVQWGRGTSGRWSTSRLSMTTVDMWISEIHGDPYNGLVLPVDRPEWFGMNLSAQEYCAISMEESGDIEFNFDGTFSTLEDRIVDVQDVERCRIDPEYFVSYFKEHIMYPPLYDHILRGAREQDISYSPYICINPRCHNVTYVGDEHANDTPPAIKSCVACSGFTMVHETRIDRGPPPDAVIMALAFFPFKTVRSASKRNRIAMEIAEQSQYCKIRVENGQPFLWISRLAPQLYTRGDHFIRARINREVLSEQNIASGIDTGSNIHAGFVSMNNKQLELLRKLMSDELMNLDPERGSKFREEYIDERWEEELVNFVGKLREKGILLVDSIGMGDTLTALYHLAQKKAGASTVIKKNGNIRFPTSEVLENIDSFMMTRAFEATEHPYHAQPSDVFRLD
jgi:hypothetical protein